MPLKITYACCNQTGGDWANNLENIFQAINGACEEQAHILVFGELALSGSDCGDYFEYTKNKDMHLLLQQIADYANKKKPELQIFIGHAWRYANKTRSEAEDRQNNPLYNRLDRPFIVQTLVSHGRIRAMFAKSTLNESDYQQRYFTPWDVSKTKKNQIIITLPQLSYIRDNKLVVLAKQAIPFGLAADIFRDQKETFSPIFGDHFERLFQKLELGTSGGAWTEGTSFKPIKLNTILIHDDNCVIASQNLRPIPEDTDRLLRQEALWLFDYLRKNKLKGYVMSFSGRADDAYSAYKVKKMIEYGIDDLGLKGFATAIHYTQKILAEEKDDIIKEILLNLLTCIYCDDASTTPLQKKVAENFVTLLGAKFESYNIESLVKKALDIASPSLSCKPTLSLNDQHQKKVMQNLRNRLRSTIVMKHSNSEKKIAISNANLSEIRRNQPLAGGNLHSGQICINAHITKTALLKRIAYIANNQESLFKPIIALYSSEQCLTHRQQDVIAYFMLHAKKNERKYNPIEVFETCRQQLCFQDISNKNLYEQIYLAYKLWADAQPNIHAAPLAPLHDDKNVDHQVSLRTPNINAFHRVELAQLKLYCLKKMDAHFSDNCDHYFQLALIDAQWVEFLESQTLEQLAQVDRQKIQSYLKENKIWLQIEAGRNKRTQTTTQYPKKPQKILSESVQLKIASASCNQTGRDWINNLNNIFQAIDQAILDNADLLCLEEMALFGYDCGDTFKYADNNATYQLLQIIADYALSKNQNLMISIGHPWFVANIHQNTHNKLFNVQTLLAGGDVVAISAKKYLYEEQRGYENRYFIAWNDQWDNKNGEKGTIDITLPSGRTVPLGSPVINAGGINLFHVICEEYWVASPYDHHGSEKKYHRDNPLAKIARNHDITVAINANASPPAPGKIDQHRYLSQLASQYCAVLVHTNGLGSSGSTYAQCGSRLFAQQGKIIAEGSRASLKAMAYTAKTVVVNAPREHRQLPHAQILHSFSSHTPEEDKDTIAAPWDRTEEEGSLEYRNLNEELRTECLWLFDYMRKRHIRGLTQALSGGADSAYNAAKVRLMVELAIQDRHLKGFLDALAYPEDQQLQLLAIQKTEGNQKTIDTIMSSILTCAYLATPNNSADTLRAAYTLINGYTDETGTVVATGIGGKWIHCDIQPLVNQFALLCAKIKNEELYNEAQITVALIDIEHFLKIPRESLSIEHIQQLKVKFTRQFGGTPADILCSADGVNGLVIENIQARLRTDIILMITDFEQKTGMANPNLDEICNAYTTFKGDEHAGEINPNGHKPKAHQLRQMQLLYEHGLHGLQPITAFHWVLKNKPSAELQPMNTQGKVQQFDEDTLGRTFKEIDRIIYYMLHEKNADGSRNHPIQVFEKLKTDPIFADLSLTDLHDKILLTYHSWAYAQHKIHAGPIVGTYGINVDKQTSQRTPNINAFHRPELAQLTLHCLARYTASQGIKFKTLAAGYRLKVCQQFALTHTAFAQALVDTMWTAEAKDGHDLKLDTLYKKLKHDPLLFKSMLGAIV